MRQLKRQVSRSGKIDKPILPNRAGDSSRPHKIADLLPRIVGRAGVENSVGRDVRCDGSEAALDPLGLIANNCIQANPRH